MIAISHMPWAHVQRSKISQSRPFIYWQVHGKYQLIDFTYDRLYARLIAVLWDLSERASRASFVQSAGASCHVTERLYIIIYDFLYVTLKSKWMAYAAWNYRQLELKYYQVVLKSAEINFAIPWNHCAESIKAITGRQDSRTVPITDQQW